jgi:DNA-binding NarL/FixJ family response regulator
VVIERHALVGAILSFTLRAHQFDAQSLTPLAATAALPRRLRRASARLTGVALVTVAGATRKQRAPESTGHYRGVELIAALCARGWAVLVLSSDDDEQDVAAAICAGAIGVITRQDTLSTLIATVSAVVVGAPVMSEAVRQDWQRRHHRNHERRRELTERLARLSPREEQILTLLGQGLRADAIAACLTVSLATVRTHISAVLTKLEVNSQIEAVALLHHP